MLRVVGFRAQQPQLYSRTWSDHAATGRQKHSRPVGEHSGRSAIRDKSTRHRGTQRTPVRTHEYNTDFRRALSSFTGRCSAGTAISRDGSRPPLPPLLPLVAGPLPSLPSNARTAADHRLRWG